MAPDGWLYGLANRLVDRCKVKCVLASMTSHREEEHKEMTTYMEVRIDKTGSYP